MVTAKVVAPFCGPTRTEQDFLGHLQAVVATEPEAKRWHIVCDQLKTHQSESLVRWVAELSGYAIEYYNQTAKPFRWTRSRQSVDGLNDLELSVYVDEAQVLSCKDTTSASTCCVVR